MAIVTLDSPACPQTRRWTRAEFHRLAELGFFSGQRAELVEGAIVVQSPQNPEHVFAVDRAHRVLSSTFGQGFWVRARFPLAVGQASEPEPDVSVVPGDATHYRHAHPRHAVLVLEVSDSTLSSDSTPSYERRYKASLYARAGVQDYWILNLVDARLEVYRDPVADPSQSSGFRYTVHQDLSPAATITPLALPGVAIPVADLLGPPPAPALSGSPAP